MRLILLALLIVPAFAQDVHVRVDPVGPGFTTSAADRVRIW